MNTTSSTRCRCVCELLINCTECMCHTSAGLGCVTLELSQAQLHLSHSCVECLRMGGEASPPTLRALHPHCHFGGSGRGGDDLASSMPTSNSKRLLHKCPDKSAWLAVLASVHACLWYCHGIMVAVLLLFTHLEQQQWYRCTCLPDQLAGPCQTEQCC